MKTETAVILLIAAMFVGGIIIGAVGHKTLTEKPARPGRAESRRTTESISSGICPRALM